MSQDQPAPPKSSVGSIVLKILLVLLVALGAFAGYIASKPNDYRVERSLTMAAPPEAVFAQINNLQKWNDWSPWAKLDPIAKNTFSGPEAGEGAVFGWAGNDKVGEGVMTITKSTPPRHVEYQLEFKKPMQDTGMSEFRLEPAGEQTKVTWAMFGTYQNFLHKTMCTMMNMDAMLGPQFEDGLASLKKIVEQKPLEATPDESAAKKSEES